MSDTRVGLVRWSNGLAFVVMLESLVILAFGWGGGLDVLTRWQADAPAMVPSTALCLMAIAGAQLLANGAHRGGPWMARMLAGATVLYCFGRIIRTVLIYAAQPPQDGDRMALATAVGLSFAAIATFATLSRSRWADTIVSWVGVCGVLLTLTALGTFLLDAEAYREAVFFAGMAAHSAFSLLLLYLAALLARPESQLARTAFGPGAGSQTARRLLPVAMLGPLLLAKLAIDFEDHAWVDPSIWLTVLAACIALLSVVSLLRTAWFRNLEETRRQDEERRLHLALNGIDGAVFVFGPDGQLKLSNEGADRLCRGQATPEDWLFKARFHTLGERREIAAEDTPARQLLDGRQQGDIHTGWIDPDGNEHALRFSIRHRTAGEALVMSVFDESQGWILQENLARMDRLDAVGRMAGGISHEIANILGIIRLSADTGLLSNKPEDMQRHLGTILSACGRGAGLIDRLLALSRNQPAEVTTLDLHRFLSDIDPVLRLAMPSEIELTVTVTPDTPLQLCADPADLQAVLVNLVLNARNAIVESPRREGHITVTVSAKDTIHIEVVDDGPGMAAQVLHHARDPFFTTRLTKGGSGLGLAMIDNFVRRIGGEFDIVSRPGAGTRIILDLPRPSAPPAGEDPDDMPAPRLAGHVVLLVQTDGRYRALLSEMLRLNGAEVIMADTAAQAQEVLASGERLDLLASEIPLKGRIDGYRLAQEAQTIRPGLPVLYLATYTDPQNLDGRSVPGLLLRQPVGGAELVNSVLLSLNN